MLLWPLAESIEPALWALRPSQSPDAGAGVRRVYWGFGELELCRLTLWVRCIPIARTGVLLIPAILHHSLLLFLPVQLVQHLIVIPSSLLGRPMRRAAKHVVDTHAISTVR